MIDVKKTHVAVLMKKEVLNDDFLLYKPLGVVTGELVGKKFIDYADEKEYLSMNDIELSLNKNEYCFANVMELDKMSLEKFDISDIKNVVMDISNGELGYICDCESFIYIGYINIKDSKIETKEIDLYELLKENASLEDKTTDQLINMLIQHLSNKEEYITFKRLMHDIFKIYDMTYSIDSSSDTYSTEIENFSYEFGLNLSSHEKKEKELEEVFKKQNKTLNIKELYDETRKIVKGQDEAIKDIISAIQIDSFASSPSEKNRCLLVGKTGVGKTEIIRTIGNLIDKPFVRTDSTQITVAGYVGGTIEGNILLPLLSMCGGDLEKAENGIVALDEIDKKGSKSNDDVSGRGVLNSLLPFLDGTEFNVKYNNRNYRFDTSKLTIFALGAFMNILDYQTRTVIGFNSVIAEPKEITLDDFNKIGMMPSEFIGRFPVLIVMNDLTLDNYLDILVNSKNSALKFYERFFKEKYNIDLKYTDRFIEEIAKKAINLKTGARSLKRIIEESIKDVRWNVMSSDCQYSEIVLDEQTVNNSKIYKLK